MKMPIKLKYKTIHKKVHADGELDVSEDDLMICKVRWI
jgi:hypothetical protein